MPGIFVKYDLTALKIKVIEQHKPYWQFLVRLCGIIGGIFVVSGKYSVLQIFMDKTASMQNLSIKIITIQESLIDVMSFDLEACRPSM